MGEVRHSSTGWSGLSFGFTANLRKRFYNSEDVWRSSWWLASVLSCIEEEGLPLSPVVGGVLVRGRRRLEDRILALEKLNLNFALISFLDIHLN